MFHNASLIKAASIVALVLFILILVAGILVTAAGFYFVSSSSEYIDSSVQSIDPEDPGAGWLFLGQLFGGLGVHFFSYVFAAIGIICIIGDLIVYLPAFIAFIVYKRSQNVTAYWILMGVWLGLGLTCLLIFLFG